MGRLRRKKGRKSGYLEYLGTTYWSEVKRLVRLRDNFACQKCGDMKNLEVHHKTYYVNGKSIVGKEKQHLDCLMLLCEKCHEKEHNVKSKK